MTKLNLVKHASPKAKPRPPIPKPRPPMSIRGKPKSPSAPIPKPRTRLTALKNTHDLYIKHGLLNDVFDDIYKYIAQVGPNYKEFNTVFTSADVQRIITLMAMTMNPKTPNYNKVMDWLKKAKY
jgi:hypothetical protein